MLLNRYNFGNYIQLFLYIQDVVGWRLLMIKLHCRRLMLVLRNLSRSWLFFPLEKNKPCFNWFINSPLQLDLIWRLVIFVWKFSLFRTALNCERLTLKFFPSFLCLSAWFWNVTRENWHIDVPCCCTTSLHRHILNCHVDVEISIFKKFAHKGLTIWLNDNLDSHLLFWCLRFKWKKNDEI